MFLDWGIWNSIPSDRFRSDVGDNAPLFMEIHRMDLEGLLQTVYVDDVVFYRLTDEGRRLA